MFIDLNVLVSDVDDCSRRELVGTLIKLGYHGLAEAEVADAHVAFSRKLSARPLMDRAAALSAIPGAEERARFHTCLMERKSGASSVTSSTLGFRHVSRITIKVDDVAYAEHLCGACPVLSAYDVIAAEPANLKVLEYLCRNSQVVDLISLNLDDPRWANVKRSVVLAGARRGLHFEVNYTKILQLGANVIENAKVFVKILHGRNLVMSSGGSMAWDLRDPYSVINMGSLLGLTYRSAKAAVSSNCRSALLRGESRKLTYNGVIRIEHSFAKAEDCLQVRTSCDQPVQEQLATMTLDLPSNGGDDSTPVKPPQGQKAGETGPQATVVSLPSGKDGGGEVAHSHPVITESPPPMKGWQILSKMEESIPLLVERGDTVSFSRKNGRKDDDIISVNAKKRKINGNEHTTNTDTVLSPHSKDGGVGEDDSLALDTVRWTSLEERKTNLMLPSAVKSDGNKGWEGEVDGHGDDHEGKPALLEPQPMQVEMQQEIVHTPLSNCHARVGDEVSSLHAPLTDRVGDVSCSGNVIDRQMKATGLLEATVQVERINNESNMSSANELGEEKAEQRVALCLQMSKEEAKQSIEEVNVQGAPMESGVEEGHAQDYPPPTQRPIEGLSERSSSDNVRYASSQLAIGLTGISIRSSDNIQYAPSQGRFVSPLDIKSGCSVLYAAPQSDIDSATQATATSGSGSGGGSVDYAPSQSCTERDEDNVQDLSLRRRKSTDIMQRRRSNMPTDAQQSVSQRCVERTTQSRDSNVQYSLSQGLHEEGATMRVSDGLCVPSERLSREGGIEVIQDGKKVPKDSCGRGGKEDDGSFVAKNNNNSILCTPDADGVINAGRDCEREGGGGIRYLVADFMILAEHSTDPSKRAT